MRVYDLMPKLEGLKALCADGLTDSILASALFPMLDAGDQKSGLSRLKSADTDLLQQKRDLLTEEFNAWINKNVLAGNAPPGNTGVLRSDDWERPLPHFFGQLALALEPLVPNALARAHAGILRALHGLERFAEPDHALLVAAYDSSDVERYRFPDSAKPADPRELPPTRLTAGDQMIAALTREVSGEPVRGWLFFVRNPDERQGLSQSHYVWDQDLGQMVYWEAGGPFGIPARHIGALPGYPAKATKLTGLVTAFLLVEPLNSSAVEGLLRKPAPKWDGVSAPSFESTVHLITCAQRLFQRGAAERKKFAPPKLYVRRYKIDPKPQS